MFQNNITKQNLLWIRIDEVLFYHWDPIGVNDEPCARDEYKSYIPNVYNFVIKEQKEELIHFLKETALITIGVDCNLEHHQKTAKKLFDFKYAIKNNLS